MKQLIIYGWFLVLVLCYAPPVFAQEVARIESLKSRLETEAYDIPHLLNKVSVSISGVSLYEFLRGVAIENKLNMNIDPVLDTPVTINFTDVTVSDLLVYLCQQYNTEVLLTGNNILSVVKYYPPKPEPVAITPRSLKINYKPDNDIITYDLQNDTLGSVLKYITQLSGYNVVTIQKLQNTIVSGYVENMPLKKALAELAHINNLQLSFKDSTTIYFEDIPTKSTDYGKVPMGAGIKVITNNKDSILSIHANNTPIKDILASVAAKLNINYFVLSDIKGTVDVRMENVDFNTFIKNLFNGTDYTYHLSNGIYLIGERKLESIRASVIYKLMYRTTTKILEAIPSELKKGLEIIPLVDLNSLVISGSAPGVGELETFLRQIDKSVPVINIELYILDITKTHNISTGISAGVDNTKTTNSTYSSVFPNVDVTLGANTVNSIISMINGTGLVNLGNVNANFYLSLKASEDNGLVKIRSTPRLATLNGSEAEMTIGETRYYAETQSNIIATQSTTTVNSIVYKPLQANLSVTIKPIVSGDEQITLDITVNQGSFTSQVSANGPYGQTNRMFKSSIRVKNNDMILLGGLEQKSKNNSGKGFPFLANIPVIKWLFSSRSANNSKTKLAILIHPTVIY